MNIRCYFLANTTTNKNNNTNENIDVNGSNIPHCKRSHTNSLWKLTTITITMNNF